MASLSQPLPEQAEENPAPHYPLIHIIRHGQSLHNVDRGYRYTDPPLTSLGEEGAKSLAIVAVPDLIVISPMTRAIQTAMIAFPNLLGNTKPQVDVQIWPELREAHDAICNKDQLRQSNASPDYCSDLPSNSLANLLRQQPVNLIAATNAKCLSLI